MDLKKRISQKKAEFISMFSVGLIIISLVFVLTSKVMSRSLRDAEERYTQRREETLDGYTYAIRFYLENHKTSLMSLYDENMFRTATSSEIQKWLVQNKDLVHDDFYTVFYVDTNKTGFFSNGNILGLSGRRYLLSPEEFGSSTYFVSDIIETPFCENPVFVVEIPIFDKDRKFKGTLCAAIIVDTLKKIADIIKIGSNSSVYVMDRTGKFLIHPKSEYIGKIFVPKTEKYKSITSNVTASSDSGIDETENENGIPVDLFHKKIDECGWTLGVAFPKEQRTKLYRQQNLTKALTLVISTAALLTLLLIEELVSRYFYSRHMIESIYDPLTMLWTRERFERKASDFFKKMPNDCFMLIEADIRGFKFINQNYGEEKADEIILFYSKLLDKMTKKHHGIIARGYADHFYSLMKVDKAKHAIRDFKESVEKICAEVKSFQIPFFPKFGITFLRPSEKPLVTIKDLIGQASFAKSTVKDNLLVPFSIYNSRLLDKSNQEHLIETKMESALLGSEFYVMYQPKIRLSDDKIVGAEALVRWESKDLGSLTPDTFIPIFEKNGFITKLDFYVYERVFEFIHMQLAEGKNIVPISVNMSRNHNKPEKFMHDFMKLFRKFDISPKLVQVEILERSVMDNNTLCEITDRLHEEGFTVAMDDFGSGESSLNMLTKIPVDVLKFDRDFLRLSTGSNGNLDKKSAGFIKSLINMSKELEKETIFEGVETESQRDFLRDAECDQVQGFFYSKPLDELAFVEFLEKKTAKGRK